MKTIICPTDFSSNADSAFHYAMTMAEKIHAKIYLLHAFAIPVAFSEMPMTAIQKADEQIKEQADKNLEKRRRKAATEFPDIVVEGIAVHGMAHDQIIQYSDLHSADFIVMGTTGMGNVERFVMGSTTSKVIQNSNCPVLCIPRLRKFSEPKKIVFATDMHEDNLQAAVRLTAFAKIFKAEVVFLFVDSKHLVHTDKSIIEMTAKIKQRIHYPGISGYICSEKSITKGIDYFLEQHPADILAMYTHKKTLAERLLHSSVTKAMASHSHIPLLVFQKSERFVLETSKAMGK